MPPTSLRDATCTTATPPIEAHVVTFGSESSIDGGFAVVRVGQGAKKNEAMRVRIGGPCCVYFGYGANQLCIAGVDRERSIIVGREVTPSLLEDEDDEHGEHGEHDEYDEHDEKASGATPAVGEPPRATRKLSVALTAQVDVT